MKHCNRCKLAIDTTKERYIIVEDKEAKKLLSKLYFHKNCWHEIMTGKGKMLQMQERAMRLLGFAEDKVGIENKEEVIM